MLAPNMGARAETELSWMSPAPAARDPAGRLHPIWVHARRYGCRRRRRLLRPVTRQGACTQYGCTHGVGAFPNATPSSGPYRGRMLAPNMSACTEAQLCWGPPAPAAREPAGCLHPIWVHAPGHSSPGCRPLLRPLSRRDACTQYGCTNGAGALRGAACRSGPCRGRMLAPNMGARTEPGLFGAPLADQAHVAGGCLHPIWVHARRQSSPGRPPLLQPVSRRDACTQYGCMHGAQLSWTRPAPALRDPAGCLHPIWVHAWSRGFAERYPLLRPISRQDPCTQYGCMRGDRGLLDVPPSSGPYRGRMRAPNMGACTEARLS